MALIATFRLGPFQKLVNGPVLFGRKCDLWSIRSATICGKAMRTKDIRDKPSPWPYKEKGYTQIRSYFEKTSKRFDENTRVIFVEGPPAIGKTKLAKALADDFDMKYFPMPTTDYMYINEYGIDSRDLEPVLPKDIVYLDERRFIKEPHHHSTPMVSFHLYHIKVSQYIDALTHLFNTGQGVVLERCFLTDYAFAEAMQKCGYLYKAELDGYYKVRNETLESDEFLPPHLMIYLDASVDTVLKNFEKRGLGEEKTYNRDFLTHLEDVYKRQALVEVDKHAEVLVYDWNEEGEVGPIVEDIERIDFEVYTKYDEKMRHWRFENEWKFCEKRWLYTHKKELLMSYLDVSLYDCPRLYWSGDQVAHLFDGIFEDVKYGFKFIPGYNSSMGDKDIWKKNFFPHPAKIHGLPENVTEMLLKRAYALEKTVAKSCV